MKTFSNWEIKGKIGKFFPSLFSAEENIYVCTDGNLSLIDLDLFLRSDSDGPHPLTPGRPAVGGGSQARNLTHGASHLIVLSEPELKVHQKTIRDVKFLFTAFKFS